MTGDFELTIVARVDGTPVILARFQDDALLRHALRLAIDAAVRHSGKDANLLHTPNCPKRLM